MAVSVNQLNPELTASLCRLQFISELFEASWQITRALFRPLVVPWTLILLVNQIMILLVTIPLVLQMNPGGPVNPPFMQNFTTGFFTAGSGFIVVLTFLVIYAGLCWLSIEHILYTGEWIPPRRFLRHILLRLPRYLLACFLYFVFVFCASMLCLVPGILVLVIWAPAPFLILSENQSLRQAFRRARAITRVTRPLSRKNGRSFLFWILGGIWLIQTSIASGISILSQGLTLLLKQWYGLQPQWLLVTQQVLQVPAVFVNAVVYVFTLIAIALIYHQGVLLHEAPDLIAALQRLNAKSPQTGP